MAPDRKALDRVEKLLRLAAPGSGTSESERVSAALEAARLFAEHDLTVQVREKPKPRAKRPPTRPTAPTSTAVAVRSAPVGWQKSVARTDGQCSYCMNFIARGEPIYIKMQGFGGVSYLHGNWPCDD